VSTLTKLSTLGPGLSPGRDDHRVEDTEQTPLRLKEVEMTIDASLRIILFNSSTIWRIRRAPLLQRDQWMDSLLESIH